MIVPGHAVYDNSGYDVLHETDAFWDLATHVATTVTVIRQRNPILSGGAPIWPIHPQGLRRAGWRSRSLSSTYRVGGCACRGALDDHAHLGAGAFLPGTGDLGPPRNRTAFKQTTKLLTRVLGTATPSGGSSKPVRRGHPE